MSQEVIALAIIGSFPVVVMLAVLFILDRRLIPDIKAWWKKVNEIPEGYELYPEFNGVWRLALRKKEGGDEFIKPAK